MTNINTITELNRHFGAKTLHPLVSVLYLSSDICLGTLKMNFYTILLKSHHLKKAIYGWQSCDFTDGSLICFTPNTPVALDTLGLSEGNHSLLCFHQDVLLDTALEKSIHSYTFFNYLQSEALHLSLREKTLFVDSIKEVLNELCWGVDNYSHRLIVGKIEQLLNYCCRFYRRQFITRNELNTKIVEKTDRLIEDYFQSGNTKYKGSSTLDYCSGKLGCSNAYLDDLLKHETGKICLEYAHNKRFAIALEQLIKTSKSVTDIADGLGYSSVQYFSVLFKQQTGYTPNEYRTSIN